MDFFEAQDRARRRTTRLVLLFVLAVTGIILSGYAGVMALTGQVRDFNRERDRYHYAVPGRGDLARWWDPQIFLWVAGGTCAVVGVASLFKWMQLRQGGSVVAEQVGGRLVDPRTAHAAERRLLNVVEEMAIASGTPVPAVYVLDEEPGINAFAAGLATTDAAVAVTRGTLEKLNRDELQGVIAHEFSHILNGDMRLNVRLTAVLFGILVIGLIGRGVLRSLGRGRVRGGGGKNKGAGIALILAIGLALLVIGYVGYFFGRLIQAAVSRQREFLADASAVQFTRNPAGIAGALRKIGGYALGAHIASPRAGEFSHFFIAQAFKSSFGGLWATHPPLDARIRAIDPHWDGKLYEPEQAVDVSRESFRTAGFGGPRPGPDETARRAFAAEADIPPLLPPATIPFKPAAVVADVGALTESHLRHAQTLLRTIPERLRAAAQDPVSAPVLVYGLFLQPTLDRGRAIDLLTRLAGVATVQQLAPLRPAISILDPAVRLPLLQLCVPALKLLPRPDLERLLGTLDELVHADTQVTRYEFVLQRLLVRHLGLGPAPGGRPIGAFRADLSLLLSFIARTGGADETAAARAFAAGAAQLGGAQPPEFLPAERCTLEALDDGLDRLARAPLAQKKALLTAAAHVVGHDGQVTVEEGELFRAVAAALDCPVPVLGAA